LVVVIKEKLESIMTLGNISENSPLGQELKKSIITTNSSSNNGREEASVVSTRTESAAAVVARNEAAVNNVDQPYYLTAAF
jgi:predicted phage gp36 major capsid-like protein